MPKEVQTHIYIYLYTIHIYWTPLTIIICFIMGSFSMYMSLHIFYLLSFFQDNRHNSKLFKINYSIDHLKYACVPFIQSFLLMDIWVVYYGILYCLLLYKQLFVITNSEEMNIFTYASLVLYSSGFIPKGWISDNETYRSKDIYTLYKYCIFFQIFFLKNTYSLETENETETGRESL